MYTNYLDDAVQKRKMDTELPRTPLTQFPPVVASYNIINRKLTLIPAFDPSGFNMWPSDTGFSYSYNSLTFLRGVAFITGLFLLTPAWYSRVPRDHSWFNRSPVEGHRTCSHARAGFRGNRNFHYRGKDAQECPCWVTCLVVFSFFPRLIFKSKTQLP